MTFRTNRLYFSTNNDELVDLKKENVNFNSVNMVQDNACNGNFDIGTAELDRLPDERMSIALVKSQISSEINLFDSNSSISSKVSLKLEFNDASSRETGLNVINLVFSSGKIFLEPTVAFPYYIIPFSYINNIADLVNILNAICDWRVLTTATLAAPPPPVVVETEQKVNLDGSNDHINIPMDSNNPVLNWDESWSIGFTAEEVHGHDSGQGVKRTIATRGTNGIYLIIGTGNVGFYASATDGVYDPANNQGMTHAHGANTWYPSPSSVKWLFTYNHTTGKLKWFVGEVVDDATPSYVQRGTITMTTTERTINQSSEDLNIGDAMEGYYGSTYFDGHLDDLLITNNELTGQQLVDYYTDDSFQSHEYAEHIISVYNFNQTYPNVEDQVSNYDGTHEGSTNSDNFIATGEIPDTTADTTTDPPENVGTPAIPATEDSYELVVADHPYTPDLNGTYVSVGSYYRDNSPPRYFKESVDHHLFRRDTETNTYLLFSYGIHTTATWYIGIYPLLSTTVDYLSHNHTTLGQISQHSIGTGWNDFSEGGTNEAIGHHPTAAYTPSHSLVGTFTAGSPAVDAVPAPVSAVAVGVADTRFRVNPTYKYLEVVQTGDVSKNVLLYNTGFTPKFLNVESTYVDLITNKPILSLNTPNPAYFEGGDVLPRALGINTNTKQNFTRFSPLTTFDVLDFTTNNPSKFGTYTGEYHKITSARGSVIYNSANGTFEPATNQGMYRKDEDGFTSLLFYVSGSNVPPSTWDFTGNLIGNNGLNQTLSNFNPQVGQVGVTGSFSDSSPEFNLLGVFSIWYSTYLGPPGPSTWSNLINSTGGTPPDKFEFILTNPIDGELGKCRQGYSGIINYIGGGTQPASGVWSVALDNTIVFATSPTVGGGLQTDSLHQYAVGNPNTTLAVPNQPAIQPYYSRDSGGGGNPIQDKTNDKYGSYDVLSSTTVRIGLQGDDSTVKPIWTLSSDKLSISGTGYKPTPPLATTTFTSTTPLVTGAGELKTGWYVAICPMIPYFYNFTSKTFTEVFGRQ